MDRNKKIIVAVVSVVFVAALSGFIKVMLFSQRQSEQQEGVISIMTPGVDEQKIPKASKLKTYEKEGLTDAEGFRGQGGFLDNMAQEDPPVENDGAGSFGNLPYPEGFANIGQAGESEMDRVQADRELKELMELQKSLLQATQSEATAYDGADVEAILDYYEKNANASTVPGISTGSLEVSPETIAKAGVEVSAKVQESVKQALGGRGYFQGAGSAGDSRNVLQLIPAETIDGGVLKKGSTIAIRTKKEVRLRNPDVWIPKGAVLYGKVDITTDRLMIDIQSYRNSETLYKIDFSLYDFDGREGVHLGNRTWPKIPSKVAKDVYEYAYQRGTQATNSAFGGGDNDIDLDEAKDMAILSGANHLGQEIFEKRRVHMPRKYHLWFNVNTQ